MLACRPSTCRASRRLPTAGQITRRSDGVGLLAGQSIADVSISRTAVSRHGESLLSRMGGTCYNCEAAKAREAWAWTGHGGGSLTLLLRRQQPSNDDRTVVPASHFVSTFPRATCRMLEGSHTWGACDWMEALFDRRLRPRPRPLLRCSATQGARCCFGCCFRVTSTHRIVVGRASQRYCWALGRTTYNWRALPSFIVCSALAAHRH